MSTPQETPGPEPALPTTRVRWSRDWRLGRSLVGKGTMAVRGDSLVVEGRRTGPVRSLLVLALRLTAMGVFLGGCGAVTLTSIGMTWRTRTPQYLAWAIPGFLLVLLLSVLSAWIGRRLLEPRVILHTRWAAVTALHSDGWQLELALQDGSRRWLGRMRPNRYTREFRMFLVGLAQGARIPDAPAVSWPRPRSRRIDQLALASVLVASGMVLHLVWPWLLPLVQGPSAGGPDTGIPARASAGRIEALARACPQGPRGAPAIQARLEGQDLHWSPATPSRGWSIVQARWVPGGSATMLTPTSPGLVSHALDGPDEVAVALEAPSSQAASIQLALAQGDMARALCSGAVSRLDLAATGAAVGPGLTLHRDGDDLVATVSGLDLARGGWRLLVARQRDTGRLDWLDRCELPVSKGRVVILRARDQQRLPNFFEGSRDEARAAVLPASMVGLARRRLGNADAVPCAEIDALSWTGLASATAWTGPPESPLRDETVDRVRATPLFAPGAGHDTVVDAVHTRYREVLHAARGEVHSRAQWQQVDAGFLDGLPWGALLDALSMKSDLAQIERIRQRLSGEDPMRDEGELFLLRLAEELLDRVEPTAEQYGARVDVAEAWIGVEAGHTWESGGRTVRVPSDEVAAYYQVVGHYLLVDLGHRVEQRMTHDLAFRVTGLPLRWRLADDGISLDIEKSSAQKALEAWVTGDFAYLGDRAVARLQQQITDQADAIAAASKARYRLQGQWSAADGSARTATLQRNGSQIGWVALYDASKVRVGYHEVDGHGISHASLGAGHPVLLAMAGSYVTADDKTAGLSAVDGNIDNFLISNKMDGLVIIDDRGGLSMLDMRQGGRLPGQQAEIRPLERLDDLHVLLHWLADHRASAFQTHLLGYHGDLAIDESKASSTVRERHMLVQAAFQGHPIIAVVDLPGTPKVSLFEGAVIALQALRTPADQGGPGLDVVAIANLDVGSYNALQAWSDDGRTLRQSWKPLGETMNLVSVSRR